MNRIDLDGDDLETFHLDGSAQIDSCADGDGRQIEGADCLFDSAMADGFSICFGFHAVPGELVIAPPDAP